MNTKLKRRKRRGSYSIYKIENLEDKIYEEDKYEEEMSQLLEKFKVIKSYQI